MVQDLSALRPPRSELDVDLEHAIKRLPPNATVKGMFVTNVVSQAPDGARGREAIYARAGTSTHKYVPFRDYPYADLIRVLGAVAEVKYPDLSLGQGVRELGKGFYEAFAGSMAGRVMFGLLGRDAERIMPLGYRGWQVCLNFGDIQSEKLGDRHVRYHFKHFPGMVETLDVGVVQGALDFCGERSDQVQIADADGRHWMIDIRW